MEHAAAQRILENLIGAHFNRLEYCLTRRVVKLSQHHENQCHGYEVGSRDAASQLFELFSYPLQIRQRGASKHRLWSVGELTVGSTTAAGRLLLEV